MSFRVSTTTAVRNPSFQSETLSQSLEVTSIGFVTFYGKYDEKTTLGISFEPTST
jgi:hypothetical protein